MILAALTDQTPTALFLLAGLCGFVLALVGAVAILTARRQP